MEERQLTQSESENNYPIDQQRHDENAFLATRSAYLTGALDYGKLLVTNLILINSGALFAFPALFLRDEHTQLSIVNTVPAVVSFAVGIIFGLFTGYASYFNYLWQADISASRSNRSAFVRKCSPEMLDVPKNVEIIAEFDREIVKLGGRINSSFYAGNCAGLCSALAFMVGCYYVWSAIVTSKIGLCDAISLYLKQLVNALTAWFV